jgi:hypothetical protein
MLDIDTSSGEKLATNHPKHINVVPSSSAEGSLADVAPVTHSDSKDQNRDDRDEPARAETPSERDETTLIMGVANPEVIKEETEEEETKATKEKDEPVEEKIKPCSMPVSEAVVEFGTAEMNVETAPDSNDAAKKKKFGFFSKKGLGLSKAAKENSWPFDEEIKLDLMAVSKPEVEIGTAEINTETAPDSNDATKQKKFGFFTKKGLSMPSLPKMHTNSRRLPSFSKPQIKMRLNNPILSVPTKANTSHTSHRFPRFYKLHQNMDPANPIDVDKCKEIDITISEENQETAIVGPKDSKEAQNDTNKDAIVGPTDSKEAQNDTITDAVVGPTDFKEAQIGTNIDATVGSTDSKEVRNDANNETAVVGPKDSKEDDAEVREEPVPFPQSLVEPEQVRDSSSLFPCF